MSSDYDSDYHAWSLEQALLLRSGRFGQLDIANLAEEIEDLGSTMTGFRNSVPGPRRRSSVTGGRGRHRCPPRR